MFVFLHRNCYLKQSISWYPTSTVTSQSTLKRCSSLIYATRDDWEDDFCIALSKMLLGKKIWGISLAIIKRKVLQFCIQCIYSLFRYFVSYDLMIQVMRQGDQESCSAECRRCLVIWYKLFKLCSFSVSNQEMCFNTPSVHSRAGRSKKS